MSPSNVQTRNGPTFTVNGDNTVTATGSVAGIGNQNLDILLAADLRVEVVCRNSAGSVAPGHTQTTTMTGVIEDINPKNGRATFTLTTFAPTLDGTPEELGCPNNQWTAEIGDVTVLGATLEVYRGSQLVLSASETF